MNSDELSAAGLTKNESKVYRSLLELGPSLAGQISRKTGLHRRTVYDTTEMLITKGLVGYILKNNRRLFQASDPKRILEIIKEKEEIVLPIMADLEKKFMNTKEHEETNFYKGKEGLKTVFEDQLNYKEIMLLGASPMAYEVLKYYFKWYDQTRKQKKIKTRIIAQDRKIKHIALSEIRYLPEKYSSPVSVNIYGDKVAIILWASLPFAVVIKNKEISQSYKNYFEILWKIAKN
jgi:sugar-specific transcriptional regulator TrmB